MPLPRLLSWLKAPPRRPIRTRSTNRVRPGIEVLEDRCVPSTFNVIVDTNSDYSIATAPSGFVSLRQAIIEADAHEAANPGDTTVISFSHTLYYFAQADSSTAVVNLDNFTTNNSLPLTYDDPSILPADAPLPTVTGNVVIDGGRVGQNPMTIDGGFAPTIPNHGVQIFTIGAGANVTIKNFILQNSDANETPTLGTLAGGEGAFVQNGGTSPAGDPALGGTVYLLNDQFKTSYAQFGAALYNGLGDTMTIQGGTFQSNDAAADNYLSFDQQPPLKGQGGAIYNAGNLSFGSTNTFNSDYATDSGGAIYNSGTMNVTSSIGQFSVAQSFEGGAIYNIGTIVGPMTGWSFTTNTAYDNGGAIWNNSTSSLTLASDTFTTNNADTDGGAVYNIGTGGLILNDGTAPTKVPDTFLSNNALNDGGAIYNTSTFTASSASAASATTFTTNTALAAGGAIYNSGAMNLNFVSISGLAGPSSTGFDAASGGGIYTTGSTVTLGNITFTSNNAGGNLALNGNGGGLFVASGNVTVNNAAFIDNTATDIGSGGQDGGAIYINGGTVTLNATTSFTGNQTTYGGAVFLNTGTLNIDSGVTFGTSTAGNVATGSGGAIYVNDGTLAVLSATFTGNSATTAGGAVYIENAASASIAGATFNSNSAGQGGAIWTDANLSLLSDVFGAAGTGNSATSSGGALYVNDGTTTLIDDTFTSNQTQYGGAILNGFILQATAISLVNNTASFSGGGIFNYSEGNSYLYNSTLTGNSATYGGGIYNSGGNLSLVNDTISFNTATDAGGGIYNAATLSLINTIVAQNTAPTGPDIYNSASQSTSANANYINHVYEALLGRPADAGAAGWVTMLNNGVSPVSVVLAIESSTEYLQDQIKAFYTHYLGRTADPSGLNAWTNFLKAGGTFEQVIQGIAGSPEFFAHAGGTNTTFVAALYSDILGRPGSSGEIGAWVNVIAAGTSRSAVAGDFLGSQEYRTGLVKADYLLYLGRSADAGGLAAWVAQLNAGVTDQVVAANILGSPEAVGSQSLSTGYAVLAYNLIGNNSGSGIATTVGNGNLVGTSASPISPAFTSSTPASVNGSPPVLIPSSTSPVVDHGTSSVINAPYNLTTDETGAARLQGFSVDIGAVETAPPSSGGSSSSTSATVYFYVQPRVTTTFNRNQVLPYIPTTWPYSLTTFQILTQPKPTGSGSVGAVGGINLTISPAASFKGSFSFTFKLIYKNSSGGIVGYSAPILGIVTIYVGNGLVVHA